MSDQWSLATGGLFRGAPAYAPCTPWRPVPALAVAIAITVFAHFNEWMLSKTNVLGLAGAVGPLALMRIRFIFVFVPLIGMILVASMLRGGRALDVLALRAPSGGWRTYVGATLLLVVLKVVLAVFYAAAHSEPLLSGFDIVNLVRGGPDLALHAAIFGIGPGLSEEMLWRGFLLAALAQTRLGFWGAALVSTGLWVAAHDRLWGLPLDLAQASLLTLEFSSLFLKGIFFSWLLWRTGSLRPAILCHGLDNFLHISVGF